jgi:hypothetical protein
VEQGTWDGIAWAWKKGGILLCKQVLKYSDLFVNRSSCNTKSHLACSVLQQAAQEWRARRFYHFLSRLAVEAHAKYSDETPALAPRRTLIPGILTFHIDVRKQLSPLGDRFCGAGSRDGKAWRLGIQHVVVEEAICQL